MILLKLTSNYALLICLVDEATLSLRRTEIKPKEPKAGRGWLWMYSNHVTQANNGCDFDFLETNFGKSAKEPDIF